MRLRLRACCLAAATGIAGISSFARADISGLPDPFIMANGVQVVSAEQWRSQRRPELLKLMAREMYGQAPGRPAGMKFQVFDTDPKALGGKATRRQINIQFTGDTNAPSMDLLVYLPNGVKGPCPVILGFNFWGNHTVHADPGVRLPGSWMESNKNPFIDLSSVVNHRATDACRGLNARQWPIETFLARGYGLATAYRGDIDPDRPDGFTNSVRALFPELQGRSDNFSTIGAWAWALSRAMDYLVTDAAIDARRVAVFGWSRLGKAALWAAATDERFALAISNESGAGGAKLFRHWFGEDISRLNRIFPHWYCQNFRKYTARDNDLPFDQHFVIDLIAPRPVYIGSAEDDKNADPEGEFLAAKAAEPVYQFLGAEGLPAPKWPPVNQPAMGKIGYHVRSGNHDVTEFDWVQYLAFMDKQFGVQADK